MNVNIKQFSIVQYTSDNYLTFKMSKCAEAILYTRVYTSVSYSATICSS